MLRDACNTWQKETTFSSFSAGANVNGNADLTGEKKKSKENQEQNKDEEYWNAEAHVNRNGRVHASLTQPTNSVTNSVPLSALDPASTSRPLQQLQQRDVLKEGRRGERMVCCKGCM